MEINKHIRTSDYNYDFNAETGFFRRWGETVDDDPDYSKLGPEILDIEVSTICNGPGKPCPWCYKSNTGDGKNMSLETFKTILGKMPKVLTQAAFGIGDIDANPDLIPMFEYCRENSHNSIIPNVTINGWNFTKKHADTLANICGAVAVSRYDTDTTYNAIKMLTDAGLDQVNIHMLLSENTFDKCKRTLTDIKKDKRLEKLNAIVFLLLKPKGKRNTFKQIKSLDKYKELTDLAFEQNVAFGFDSCSAPSFIKVIKDRDNYEEIKQAVEPCESGLFSSYINVDGIFYPCSFTEEIEGLKGLNVIKSKDFLEDIWYHPQTVEWRRNLINCNRECPVFDLNME